MDHSRNFQGINKHCTTKSKATVYVKVKIGRIYNISGTTNSKNALCASR